MSVLRHVTGNICIAYGSLNLATGQSFEGGISGAPGTEAHGAYAFCALACLCILDRPEEIIPK